MSLARATILRALTFALLVGAASTALGESGEARRPAAVPVVLSGDRPPAPLRRLTPRGETSATEQRERSGLSSTGSALSALAVVVLAIIGAARLWKKHGPKLPAAAPRDAIEVLGRCRIESRQSVYLVRLGSRVLVLGSSGGELSTLSEVTDPVEVDLITSRCRDESCGVSPFSRLFEARRKAEAEPLGDSAETAASSPEPRPARWHRSPVEQRLAARVRGTADAEANRAA